MKRDLVSRIQSVSHRLYRKGIPVLPRLLFFFLRLTCGCSIPPQVEIGKDVRFAHNGLGCIVHEKCTIGKGTVIQGNVVLGGSRGKPGPKIGNYCYIGAGAVAIGDITIGDDCVIGANAVVNKNIPAGSVAVGVPAKIIRQVDESLIGKEKP